jgi:hypothetical protein
MSKKKKPTGWITDKKLDRIIREAEKRMDREIARRVRQEEKKRK